jgi:nifR3 family TIM-barrel protein
MAFPGSLEIGGVHVAPATVLAPMAGVTDATFRRTIRRLGGCGLIVTEFTSSHGVVGSSRTTRPGRTFSYLVFEEGERPIAAQLFGSDPAVMAEAARVCQGLGFDMLDINLGCPVRKVVRCNGGSSLLRDLPQIERILSAVRSAISIPLTIKFRSGWSSAEIVATRLALLAQECGVDAVAFHPRTREQGYSGHSDWSLIAAVKSTVRVPVIGNGDVTTPEEAVRMVAETGCDGVMIGRAAAYNPWIFRQLEQYLAIGSYSIPTVRERYELMREYYAELMNRASHDASGKMKQFATYFTHGVHRGATLRGQIHHASSPAEIINRLNEFFLTELEASGEPG